MDLEAENASLRAALRALQERYDALEASASQQIQALTDENELLAEANRLLLEKQAQSPSPASADPKRLLQVPDELLLPGPELAIRPLAALDDVHAFGNLLSVSAHATRPEIVVSGGADKCICVHDWQTGRKLCAASTSAPVLALAFNPRRQFADYFVGAGMDAKHALYRLARGQADDWHVETLGEFSDHTRHGAFKVAWSASGLLFATGSSDKSLNIYRCSQLEGGANVQCEKIKSFYFNGTVEAIVFAPEPDQGASKHELLVIAVRDDCYVHYVDCSTFEKERVNMNPDGIEHVSYTIMDLSLSPSGKYLLAATDSNRNFIFSVKRNVALRSFYGHKAGPYSQPRAAWHPSEKYVISNNEESGAIFVWSIASERVVETFDAHEALVRDLVCPATVSSSGSPMLVTVSYDKRMKVWESPLAKAGVEILIQFGLDDADHAFFPLKFLLQCFSVDALL
ncbi:WD40 repeat-containing protein [Phytophthora cinnamomi]|uniref:WD40 repeat-containing protein n=1 Tax=Phytophthora cinnamomi TaxID=4785 RepID=UPI00355AAEFC|nr:WD40 repeat-containing protein [Phytophthora cinnamomi]